MGNTVAHFFNIFVGFNALIERAPLNYDFIWEWQANPFCWWFFPPDCLGVSVSLADELRFNSIMSAVDHLQITIVGYSQTYTSQMRHTQSNSKSFFLLLLSKRRKKMLLIFMSVPLVSFPFFRVLWAGIYSFYYYFQFRNLFELKSF